MRELFIEYNIEDPVSGTTNWTDVRQFNLMFSTQVGSVAEDSNKIYLRPETAQGIFVNFLNVQKTARQKIPFGSPGGRLPRGQAPGSATNAQRVSPLMTRMGYGRGPA